MRAVIRAPRLRLPQPLIALPLFAMIAGIATSASAQVLLPQMGGPGGGRFEAVCPAALNLVGLEIRGADDVDAVRPVCAPAYGPQQTGRTIVAPNWHGGDGGSFQSLTCPPAAPVVIAIDVAAEGQETFIVDALLLYCGRASPQAQAKGSYPNALFDGPEYRHPRYVYGVAPGEKYTQQCPPGQVAVGIHGHSGIWLDAIGLVCDAPRLTSPPRSVGRANRGLQPADRTLCEAASDARTRGSPVAARLLAQCTAYQASLAPPVGSIGRVNAGAAAPSGSLCDRAADARLRHSPVAERLERQCRAFEATQPPASDPAGADDPSPDGAR